MRQAVLAWPNRLYGTTVALDTAPVIYFIEKHPVYYSKLLPFFEAVHRGDIQAVTSTLTLTEVLVVPFRTGNLSLVADYTDILLHAPNLRMLAVTDPIARKGAELRANLRYNVPDAIQIATAIIGNAATPLTNDSALKALPGLSVAALDQL
jgi:predicted nucleic acid-binding protein